MRLKSLDEVFADDLDGLLNSNGSSATAKTEDDRLVESFNEISEFYKENDRAPESNMSNMKEFQLHSRLNGFKNSPEKIAILQKYDYYNLLTPAKEIESIDDIFNDDDLGLFDESEESIFTIKNIPTNKNERAETDFVARRKPCKDFDKYEHLFKKVQAELKSGVRTLKKFKETSLVEGNFFILNGVLVYLNKLYDQVKDHNHKLDGRTHCIFENGTESNMLFRSLGKGLYENGFTVSTPNRQILSETEQALQSITKDDQLTGYIYVLKSLAKKSEIQSIPDLYKIGFTVQTVEERIKGAEHQATYLMAPVHPIYSYPCFNMNVSKLESLIHTFFSPACVDIEIIDTNGKLYHPREWFSVPLKVIEEAISMIIDGSIIKYRYDVTNKMIVRK